MSKAVGLSLFAFGGILIVLSLFPTGETPFSLAAKGIIPEETAKLFFDSDALSFLIGGVIFWTIVFALCEASIKITFVALIIFALGTYFLTGLVAFGAIGSEKTLFWVTIPFLAIPLLPMLPLILGAVLGAVLGGIAGRIMGGGGGGGGGGGREEKTIERYDDWGKYTGESKIRGDKIEHYDDWGKKVGESKVQGSRIKHYDDWGKDVGESRVQGKRIELYDSRGNLIGESKVQGNTIEHRDEQGKGKGESKIK